MRVQRSAPDVEVLGVDRRDELGEGPWWDVESGRLWWVDIVGRLIRNATLDGEEGLQLGTPDNVGFAVPDTVGGLLAGLRTGLYRHEQATGWSQLWPADYPTRDHRINDGKTDRQGRLWFGTMHDLETAPTGSLYRVDGTRATRVLEGIITSNGLGWAPDGRTFY